MSLLKNTSFSLVHFNWSTFSRGFHERHAMSASSVVTSVCQTDGIVKGVAFRVFFVEVILLRI